jgi:hypothetical protein
MGKKYGLGFGEVPCLRNMWPERRPALVTTQGQRRRGLDVGPIVVDPLHPAVPNAAPCILYEKALLGGPNLVVHVYYHCTMHMQPILIKSGDMCLNYQSNNFRNIAGD